MRNQLITLVAIAAATTGCSERNSQRELDVIRLGSHGRLSSAPMFIADDAGFFAKEGIRIEYTETPRGTQALPILDRGDLDVLSATTSAAMYSAIAKGARFRIVADRAHLSPEGCVVDALVGSRKRFTSASPGADQVRGTRFAIAPAGTAAFVVDAYLKSIGLSLADIELVTLPANVQIQALEAGSIDVASLSEPFLSQATALGLPVLGVSGRLAPMAHMGVLLYSPALLARPELAQRFMNAYLRGARRYMQGATDANIEILARRMGFAPELLRKSCLPRVDGDGRLNTVWLLEFQKWAVSRGLLDHEVGLEEGIDQSFAQRATEILKAEH